MKNPMKETGISIIVPLRNKADSIVATLENIVEIIEPGVIVWVVDDYSQDSSFSKAKNFKKKHKLSSFRVVKNSGPQGKISTIQFVMEHCKDNKYLLLLDADSMLDIRNLTLRDLQSHMDEHGLDVLAFEISPLRKNSIINHLQRIEYAIGTNGLRGFLRVVTVVSGAGSLWRTRALTDTLLNHSKIFEGDDFEATILGYQKGYSLGFLQDVQVITNAPNDWGRLIWQRLMFWEVGFWRCLMGLILKTPKWLFTSDSVVAAHYRGIVLVDLLMHPLKMLTFIIFVNQLSRFPVPTVLRQLNQLERIEVRTASVFWIFLILGLVLVNYCKTADWKQRFFLNSWLAIYLSMPYISVWLVQPIIEWAKRSPFYSGQDFVGVSKGVVDIIQYLVENSAIPFAFLLWILLSMYLLLRVNSTRSDIWSLMKSVILFPIYQMAMLVFVRSISFFIWLGLEASRKINTHFNDSRS